MFLIQAINGFFQVLIYLIFGRAILSWFIRPGDRLYPIYLLLVRITEPILGPCRRFSARFGLPPGVDFSPIMALVLIWIVRWLVLMVLGPILVGGIL